MAPIKFEEHVKEKLDEREIRPSAGSWDKLNSSLDKSQKSSGGKWWMSAAAAVVVLMISSLLFLDQQNENTPVIVEEPAENGLNENSEKAKFEQPVEIASEEQEKIQELKPSNKIEESKPEKRKESTGVVAANVSNKRQPVESVSIIQTRVNEGAEAFYSEDIQALIASVVKGDGSGKQVSEDEVEALLAEARREVSREAKMAGNSALDPDELLAQAEDEIYQSFKEKIFNVLKDGYQKAVIAVSNRNAQSREY